MKSKNEFSTHTLDNLANLAKQNLKRAKTGEPSRMPANDEVIFQQEQQEAAKHVSSILSGLYRQKSASEWGWLQLNQPKWWTKRIELENEVDAHFLDGNPEAAQEAFYQLVAHLKAASIDELSSRIARQLDSVELNNKRR